jgi:cbb3-type cytochrome oxidase subunit 1
VESYVSGFIRSALIWLVAGTSLGGAMALHPVWAVYRTAHFHMLLLGFVSMFIIGVAYHVIPRFSSTPLRSPMIARLHLVVANLGLTMMVTGFCLRVHGTGVAPALLAVGGVVAMVGMWLFAWNLWLTLAGTPRPPKTPKSNRPLPQASR